MQPFSNLQVYSIENLFCRRFDKLLISTIISDIIFGVYTSSTSCGVMIRDNALRFFVNLRLNSMPLDSKLEAAFSTTNLPRWPDEICSSRQSALVLYFRIQMGTRPEVCGKMILTPVSLAKARQQNRMCFSSSCLVMQEYFRFIQSAVFIN